MNKRPYVPKGCDQQGRHPQAAEAATELGTDDCPNDWGVTRVVLTDIAIACAIVGVMALVLWLALP